MFRAPTRFLREANNQPRQDLIGDPHNGPRSFEVTRGTAINDLVKRGGQHWRLYRLNRHRRVTAPAAYGH